MQNSGKKMLIQKFSHARVQANSTRQQRAQQTAAIVALADSVLAKSAGKRKTAAPTGGVREFDLTGGPDSLAGILRARLARGQR